MNYRFRRAFERLVPSWLSTGEGEIALYSIGLMLDLFAERAKLGIQAKFPEIGPPDALVQTGRDRKIIRGINEPDAAYASRIKRWLDDHATRGNPWALHAQLRAYCQADVRVRTVDRRGNWYSTDFDGTQTWSLDTGNWDWDSVAASPNWARFWVIIYPVDGNPWAPSDGSGVWPSGGTIGTTATPDQVASVRQIVRDWKPAGTTCEWIVVAFNDETFSPSSPEPDGHWANFGYDPGTGMVSQYVASARYWKGVSAS